MFATRSGSQGNPTPPASQSIEAVRRRARHRLIGAAVLVLLGVIGFSLLFDTQPRPISVDIPIEIPAKNQTPSLGAASTAENPPTKPETKDEIKPEPKPEAKTESPRVAANESLGAREEVVAPIVRPAPEPVAAAEPKPAPAKPEPSTREEDVAKARAAEAARAKALLEGKSASKSEPGAQERVVVQVGAFAEASGARTVRLKLERAGLRTYTHVAETSEGKRIRVRLGPYNSRAEAEKAAARVKALGLPAAILTL
jgi:DedD protein